MKRKRFKLTQQKLLDFIISRVKTEGEVDYELIEDLDEKHYKQFQKFSQNNKLILDGFVWRK